MAISDIIRSDDDRLFVVDSECYIIFTGSDTSDIRPFIRIGTWLDLPAELIPLVENIIVTDGITGNPCHEQFNIDVIDLPANRYIGSTAGLRRFLEFQRFFGLDLTSATIVHIEKDLPELSREQKLAEGNQYIGVFYRNGNCTITHRGRTFFDLSATAGNALAPRMILDRLAARNRGNRRYAGSGLVLLGRNPLFYHNQRLVPYLMPFNCLGDFSRLGIDPSAIKTVLHPSSNIINLGLFLSWKNASRSGITLYAAPRDTASLSAFFKDSRIKTHEFKGMSWRDDGMAISNPAGTYNLLVDYGTPAAGAPSSERPQIRAAYIKTAAGTRELLSQSVDVLLVSLSAYEEVTLLLKATDIPVILIDDGDPALRRLPLDRVVVLRPGIHYQFKRIDWTDGQPGSLTSAIAALVALDPDSTNRCAGDGAGIVSLIEERLMAETGADLEDRRQDFNLLALARCVNESTTNRHVASKLRDLTQRLWRRLDHATLYRDPSRVTIILALAGKIVVPVMAPLLPSAEELFEDDIRDGEPPASLPADAVPTFRRIIEDRARLRALLALFVDSPSLSPNTRDEMKALRSILAERRSEFDREWLALDDAAPRPAGTGAGREGATSLPSGKQGGADADTRGPGGDVAGLRGIIARRRRLFFAIVPLVIALIIALIVTGLHRHDRGHKKVQDHPGDVVQSRDIDRQFRELGRQKNIIVSDRDIYRYANEVALRNGYRPIARYPLREKNPDWIYPENVFIMLDGQKVVVSRGDTLWNLARNKLIGIALEYNELMERASRAAGPERRKLLDRAKKVAFTDEQRRNVEALLGPPAPQPKQTP